MGEDEEHDFATARVAGMSSVRGAVGLAEAAAQQHERSARPRLARLLGARDSTVRRALAAGDVAAMTLALGLAVLVGSTAGAGRQLLLGLLTVPLWIVLFKAYGLYDRDAKRVRHSTVDDVPWLLHALMVGTLGLYALMRLPGAERLTAEEACVFFGLAFFLLLLSRASVREITTSMLSPERLLLVGGGPYAQLLIDKVRRNRDYGIEPIAYVGDPAGGVDIPCLGDFERLEQACRITRAERVLFVAPALDDATLEDLVRRTSRLNVKIGILPHVVDALGPSLEIDHVQGVTVLGISPPELSTSSWFLKRTMDISVAAVALAVAMPVMLLVAACIKLTSPGPVLFSQERVGRRGSRFRIRKFRTMVQDAEAQESRLRPLSAHPAWLLLADDPRITRLGRVLRHTSLDELPQLWNVLVGDMSLVGPRPMPPMVDAQIQGWQRRRLDLTPGVTGLWQVLGRTDLAFEEMLKLDYLYVTNWSLWQDVKLLVQTLPVVIRRTGAN